MEEEATRNREKIAANIFNRAFGEDVDPPLKPTYTWKEYIDKKDRDK